MENKLTCHQLFWQQCKSLGCPFKAPMPGFCQICSGVEVGKGRESLPTCGISGSEGKACQWCVNAILRPLNEKNWNVVNTSAVNFGFRSRIKAFWMVRLAVLGWNRRCGNSCKWICRVWFIRLDLGHVYLAAFVCSTGQFRGGTLTKKFIGMSACLLINEASPCSLVVRYWLVEPWSTGCNNSSHNFIVKHSPRYYQYPYTHWVSFLIPLYFGPAVFLW